MKVSNRWVGYNIGQLQSAQGKEATGTTVRLLTTTLLPIRTCTD